MPEPCEFLSLNSCQKRFLRIHQEVDFVPHPVVGLVLQVGDAEKFSLRSRKPGPEGITGEEYKGAMETDKDKRVIDADIRVNEEG